MIEKLKSVENSLKQLIEANRCANNSEIVVRENRETWRNLMNEDVWCVLSKRHIDTSISLLPGAIRTCMLRVNKVFKRYTGCVNFGVVSLQRLQSKSENKHSTGRKCRAQKMIRRNILNIFFLRWYCFWIKRWVTVSKPVVRLVWN